MSYNNLYFIVKNKVLAGRHLSQDAEASAVRTRWSLKRRDFIFLYLDMCLITCVA